MKLVRFKKIFFALFLLMLIFVIGVIGYSFLEPAYSLIDCFYMTIITVSTVGFGEVHQLSDEGKLFTGFLIIISFGTFAYSISVITSYIIDGEFKNYFKDIKVSQELTKLQNHVIVCGFGRNGSQSVKVLTDEKLKFVIVEEKGTVLDEIRSAHPDWLTIEGDSTNDDVLIKAGVKTAKALITTLPNDADNLFVVLSARVLNPTLKIISRASDDGSDQKLKRAGADNVIMPDKIGGAHMASLVSKPDIIEFWDYISVKENESISLEQISFDELNERYQNKTIQELDIRSRTGANIIGYKTKDGQFIINPSADTIIAPSTMIFALGSTQQIEKLKTLFS